MAFAFHSKAFYSHFDRTIPSRQGFVNNILLHARIILSDDHLVTEEKQIDFKSDAQILSRFRQIVDCLGRRSDAAFIGGVTEDAIRKYMSGKAVPSIEVVSRLCLGARASIDWLITGEVQINPSPFHRSSSEYSCLFNPGKKINRGDFAYLEVNNGDVLIGFIEGESEKSYKVKPFNESKEKVVTVKKSELSIIAPAQIIKSIHQD